MVLTINDKGKMLWIVSLLLILSVRKVWLQRWVMCLGRHWW